MQAVQFQLPSKFLPFVLKKDEPLTQSLDQIFSQAISDNNPLSQAKGFKPITSMKDYVVTHDALPGYVIKGTRTDRFALIFGSEMNIYRLARAEKIRKVIEKNHFTEIVVPKKRLYQYQGQWFVIAEKLELDQATSPVQTPGRSGPMGWIQPEEKELTVEQARELAVICFDGRLADVNPNNLNYTTGGKVALVDTEPTDRPQMTRLKKHFRFFVKIPLFLKGLKFGCGLQQSQLLYNMISSQKARSSIKSVQNKNFWSRIIKITAYIALPLIASIGLFIGSASPILAGIAIGAIGIASVNAFYGFALLAHSVSLLIFTRSLAFQHQVAMAQQW